MLYSDYDDTLKPKRPCPTANEIPHYFFLNLLLNTSTSLWKPAPSDVTDKAMWERSNEYFDFLCRLLENLTGKLSVHFNCDHPLYCYLSICIVICPFLSFILEAEQRLLLIDVQSLLTKELNWLSTVKVPPSPCNEVQTLLAGHLKLTRALFSCSGKNCIIIMIC